MSVATSTGGRFDLNASSVRCRTFWLLLPWIAAARMPSRTRCFTILSAPCLVRANTSVRVNAVFCKKVREQVRLVPRLDEVHRLLDQLDRRGDLADLNVRRIAQPFAGQLANLGRHRGREHQRLPRLAAPTPRSAAAAR